MHVDISEILHREEGSSTDFNVSDESVALEDITLKQPLSGHIHIAKSSDGVALKGELRTSVELECDRCLRTFTYDLDFPVQAEFSQKPVAEQFPIAKNGTIELDEPIRQEILVHLPQQQLCKEDCKGIAFKQPTKDNHGSS